jgi:hypothetical protein
MALRMKLKSLATARLRGDARSLWKLPEMQRYPRHLQALSRCRFSCRRGVNAWGAPGHETVGAIADQLISGRRAEVEVHKLLKPGETLQSVANWADCAKGYCGALTEELREFVRRNPHHAHYHYTDVPFQAAAYEEGGVGTSDDDVVHILKQCIAVLKARNRPWRQPAWLEPRAKRCCYWCISWATCISRCTSEPLM